MKSATQKDPKVIVSHGVQALINQQLEAEVLRIDGLDEDKPRDFKVEITRLSPLQWQIRIWEGEGIPRYFLLRLSEQI